VDATFQEEWDSLLRGSTAVSEQRVRYRQTLSYDVLKLALLDYDIGIVLYDDRHENTRLASPAKIFEYMRAGLAVLTTSQPTPAAIVQLACCGFVVTPPDLAELALELDALVHHPERLRRLRGNALDAFQKRYAYEEAAKPLVEFLEQSEAYVA
jgi:glycosyltransferase involved in cell wall biosynthesis